MPLTTSAPARACPSRTRASGSRRSRRSSTGCGPSGSPRVRRHRPVRPDARRRLPRRCATCRCGPRSCGTTGAPRRGARNSTATHPGLAGGLGVPAVPGFTAPKLLWLRAARARVVRRDTQHVCLPKDYRPPVPHRRARHRHVGRRRHLVARPGPSRLVRTRPSRRPASTAAQVPRLVEGTAVSGLLRPALARRWGLSPGVVVAGGAGDAMAGAVGIGAVDAGPFLSLGTSASSSRPARPIGPLPQHYLHAFCHAVPGRWAQIAALLNGASCLAWLSGHRRRADRDPAGRGRRARRTGPAR